MLELAKDLPRHGWVSQNPSGFIFLDLDDSWVFDMQEELEKFGYELPPYFWPPTPVGAHISVVPAREMEEMERRPRKADMAIGKKVEFRVTSCSASFPTEGMYGVEATYRFRVTSPELRMLLGRLGCRLAGSTSP